MGDTQGGNSRNVLEHLDEWVIAHRPDIVHLNAGLHDMARDPGPGPKNRVPLDEYGANLRQILEKLLQETDAKVILALTTPVDLNRQVTVKKGVNRTPEDVSATTKQPPPLPAISALPSTTCSGSSMIAAPVRCSQRTASISRRKAQKFSAAPSLWRSARRLNEVPS